MATVTTETSIDCEGPCCCRCEACKGVGHWSSYDVTFPVSDGEVKCISGIRTFVPGASDVIQACISGNTFSVASSGQLFGSGGGTGDCIWISPICPDGFGAYRAQLNFRSLIGGGGFLQVAYPGVCVPGVQYDIISFDCRTGGTISGDPTVNCISACANNPHFPSNITIVPSAGATWNQCGQNSDGTTYTGSFSSTAPTFMTTAPTSAKSLPTIPHPDRCSNLGARTEKRAGCNGWLCKHDCSVGLPALPGIYCQTCEFYDADPDYIDQGPSGWLK